MASPVVPYVRNTHTHRLTRPNKLIYLIRASERAREREREREREKGERQYIDISIRTK